MITAADVCGIVVTRGDVGIKRVLEPLAPLGDLVLWDNSQRQDLAVYGRYAAIAETDKRAILVVDDDVALHPESVTALLAAHRPGVLVANMPEEHRPRYPSSALVGFGAIFDRDLPAQAFGRFLPLGLHTFLGSTDWAHDDVAPDLGMTRRYDAARFNRTCDIVFSTLTPRRLVDLPFDHLEHTWADNRMFRQKGNSKERQDMLKLARAVRGNA